MSRTADHQSKKCNKKSKKKKTLSSSHSIKIEKYFYLNASNVFPSDVKSVFCVSVLELCSNQADRLGDMLKSLSRSISEETKKAK